MYKLSNEYKFAYIFGTYLTSPLKCTLLFNVYSSTNILKSFLISEVKDVNVEMSREVLALRQNRYQFRLINIIMAPLKVGIAARTQTNL